MGNPKIQAMKTDATKESDVPQHEDEEVVEEFIYEEPLSWGEIIQAVFAAYSCIDDIDTGMASNADKKKIKEIRAKGLELLHAGICEIYSERFEEEI